MSKLVRKRRKADHCLNCDSSFDSSNNYCPNCGQENNHNKASFGTLVIDFLNNYFSFDSKFSMSLLPFFLSPGYLTKRFIEGKRASFVNPIRLYLIISLVFFFVFSLVSKNVVEKSIDTFDKTTKNLSDSSKQALDEVFSGDIENFNADSIIELSGINPDSSSAQYQISFEKPDSSNMFFTEENFGLYMKIRQDYDYSVDQVMDSLNTSSLSSFQFNLTKQVIRLDRAEGQVVIAQLLKNLPVMMLFTLPIFALLLKMFYLRRQQYYITHLVHALHLHSFAYLLYGLVFVVTMYWLPSGAATTYTLLGGIILVSTHSYLSFLNVYEQGWFKTFVKFNMIGFLYTILLLFAVFVEIIVSVYTY